MFSDFLYRFYTFHIAIKWRSFFLRSFIVHQTFSTIISFPFEKSTFGLRKKLISVRSLCNSTFLPRSYKIHHKSVPSFFCNKTRKLSIREQSFYSCSKTANDKSLQSIKYFDNTISNFTFSICIKSRIKQTFKFIR